MVLFRYQSLFRYLSNLFTSLTCNYLWLKSNFQNNDPGCVIFRSLSELYLCGMCYQIKLSSNAVSLQNGDQLSAHLYVIQRLFEWLSQLIPIKDIMAYHLK